MTTTEARFRPARGLTMAESLLALTVLQVAVLAVGYALAAGGDRAAQAERTVAGVDVAEELMERIVALPFDDPDEASGLGPEPGERGRALFDNADDYDGYADEVALPAGGAARVARTVSMIPARETPPGLGAAIDGLAVTVAVGTDGDPTWTLTRFLPGDAP